MRGAGTADRERAGRPRDGGSKAAWTAVTAHRIRAAADGGSSPYSAAVRSAQPRGPNLASAPATAVRICPDVGRSDGCVNEANSASARRHITW